ncbi:MAG TPA: hypothetical protein VL095_07640 [Flavisolibacter sp.]|nr:hypothetical protein [Flavisolibacter sp.]
MKCHAGRCRINTTEEVNKKLSESKNSTALYSLQKKDEIEKERYALKIIRRNFNSPYKSRLLIKLQQKNKPNQAPYQDQ